MSLEEKQCNVVENLVHILFFFNADENPGRQILLFSFYGGNRE